MFNIGNISIKTSVMEFKKQLFDNESLKKELQLIADLYRNKNLNLAEKKIHKLIDKFPNIAILYNLMGLVKSGKFDYKSSIIYYEKAIKLKSNFAEAYNNIGNSYNSLGNYLEAEINFKKAIRLNNNLIQAYNNLGNLYKSINKFKNSLLYFKKAIKINPNAFLIHNNLGLLYKSIGNIAKAKKSFKKSILINNNFSPAHRNLSQITKYKNTNKHLNILKNLFLNEKIPDPDKREISFALGKAYEDMKDYDNAFRYFNIANQTVKRNINYDINDDKKMFDDIKNKFNQNLFKKFIKSGNKSMKPIFIIGMPRSGTTLVEQIISSHPEVYGGDELNYFNDLSYHAYRNKNLDQENDLYKNIGKSYINKIEKLSNLNKITDKYPLNFKWIGFIKLALPNAKIIHCLRDPKDTCLSIFKNFFPSVKMGFAYDLIDLAEYYNSYRNLMSYWNKLLPGFIYNMRYETLIKNQKKETQNILRFCNLKWNNKCINFYKNTRAIKTASDLQARKPIYRSSLNSWKNYEKHIEYFLRKIN
tara:strand:- start:497 stop:2089 length:1593 start_codon:yes stop_codon:yes gene_type:complete